MDVRDIRRACAREYAVSVKEVKEPQCLWNCLLILFVHDDTTCLLIPVSFLSDVVAVL